MTLTTIKSFNMKHPRNFIDLTGRKIRRFTFLEYAGVTSSGNARWKVRCDCGTEYVLTATNVLNGSTYSCGCLRNENNKNRHKK